MEQIEAVQCGLVGTATERWRILQWIEQHPLAVCLPVQALLLFADLDRLPVWGDEQSSFDRAVLGIVPHQTVHPGLYFLLLRGWLSAVCGGPCIGGARALSALFVLAATVAIDRCWLRRLDPRSRTWFLILWTLSPALLLYGRMARSYSLQLVLACLALYAGSRYAQRGTLSALLAYVAASSALLHTHYLPAIAVILGIWITMSADAIVRRQPAALWSALVPPLVIGVAFAPWLPAFTISMDRVARHTGHQVGGRIGDALLGLAFTAVSFSFGETLWPWMVAALLALAPVIAVVLLRGLRDRPSWLAPVLPVAAIAFIGAHQWVSYAFVAARLLFLSPFYLLLLVQGAHTRTRLGTAVCTAVALLSVAGIAAYFEQVGFLNKAYVLPTGAIADAIRAGVRGEPPTVVLDAYNSDLSAVAARLPGDTRILYLADPESAARAIALSAEPGLRQVWFVQSTHDASPDHWNALVTDAFAGRFSIRRRGFAPYSTLDRWLMRVAGWPTQPRYAVELVELQYDVSR